MTTAEKIRLEIELEVKKALTAAKELSTEYKRLAADSASLTPSTEDVKRQLASLDANLKAVATTAGMFGTRSEALRDQQRMLQDAIKKLIAQGLTPESEEVKNLKNQYDKLTGEIAKNEKKTQDFGATVKSVLGRLAIGMAVKESLGYLGSMETKLVSFKVKLGDAAAATDLLNQTTRFAAETPFELPDVSKSVDLLLNANVPVERMNETLRLLGDTAAGSGGNISDMAMLYQQFSAQGTLYSQDLMQLANRGIPIYQEMAKVMGVNKEEVKDLASQGKIGFKEFQAVLENLAGKGGKYFGMMSEQSKTLDGMLSTLKDTALAAGSSLLSSFLPAIKGGIGALTGLLGLVSAIPSGVWIAIAVMGGLAVAIGTVVAAKKAYTAATLGETLATNAGIVSKLTYGVVTAANTIKTWFNTAATWALNFAHAPLAPWILLGVAAAVAGTIAMVGYANSQNKAATSISKTTTGIESQADGMRLLGERTDYTKKAMDAYRESLSAKTDEDIKSMIAMYEMLKAGADVGTQEWARLNTLILEMNNQLKARADKAASDAYTELANKAKDQIAKLLEGQKTELEKVGEEIKFLQQFAYLDGYSKAIDILKAKEKALIAEMDLARRESIAKLTESKVDDLDIEYEKNLEKYKDNQEAIKLIQSQYTAERLNLIAQENYDKAMAAAELTATGLDDLKAQYDLDLALAVGNEEKIAALRKEYESEVAKTRAEEMKKAFEAEMAAAASNKDFVKYAQLTIQTQTANTNVGQLGGFGGVEAANPIIMIIQEAAKMLLSIENVGKSLNFIGTIFESMKTIIEPFINGALQPFVDFLTEIGTVLGEILVPFINMFAINLSVMIAILNVRVLPVLKAVAAAFRWFNNSVIVPVGNAIIGFINGVIRKINAALGWLGVNIAEMALLKPILSEEERLELQNELTEKQKQVNDEMADLKDMFAARRKEIDDVYQKNVDSWKKLLQVGAIREAAYAQQIADLNASKESELAKLELAEESQLKVLQDILEQLKAGNNVDIPTSVSVPAYAEGATRITKRHVAIVDENETIIPGNFASGLRSGSLVLSGAGSGKSSGQTVIYQTFVEVKGSVTTLDQLTDDISKNMNRRFERGRGVKVS